MSLLLEPSSAATISFSFRWSASESLFWVRWMRNTIRNVTMVVPVLITSCQVLSNLKRGPVIAQTRMIPQARENALVLPVQRVTIAADRSSHRPSVVFFLRAPMESLLLARTIVPVAALEPFGSPAQRKLRAGSMRSNQWSDHHGARLVTPAVPVDVARGFVE